MGRIEQVAQPAGADSKYLAGQATPLLVGVIGGPAGEFPLALPGAQAQRGQGDQHQQTHQTELQSAQRHATCLQGGGMDCGWRSHYGRTGKSVLDLGSLA
jgi:hypothetical protein